MRGIRTPKPHISPQEAGHLAATRQHGELWFFAGQTENKQLFQMHDPHVTAWLPVQRYFRTMYRTAHSTALRILSAGGTPEMQRAP